MTIKLPEHAIIGIDPGPVYSAWVEFIDGELTTLGKEKNDDVLGWLDNAPLDEVCVIEMPQPYGVSVGQEVFDTCFWAGRFFQFAEGRGTSAIIKRGDVKRLLFGKVAGIRDADIRDYCIQQFGRDKSEAVGVKKKPGPLYGMKADCWQALGVLLAGVVMIQETAT